MRFGMILSALCGILLVSQAETRPGPGARPDPILKALDLSGQTSDLAPVGPSAVFQAAQGGTTWFGGTVWAADSMRWEALQGQLWTFDSGVGSSIVPPGGAADLSSPTREWVNPTKQPGLHATLEGWIGIDATYSDIPYFRRLSSADPRWSGGACVGSAAGLQGSYSFWCGVFRDEADEFCYAGGQGYGNSWFVCIEHPFSYNGVGNANLSFSYKNDIEADYDYTFVYVDTSGAGDEVEVTSYTGAVSGTASLPLTRGVHLPLSASPITIKFCVQSDGSWSDQDGLQPTACGAFAVDNIVVSGGGIVHSANFETGDGGWVRSPAPPGPGGEWADLHHVDDLPPMTFPCPCALYDSVLAFPDDLNGHGPFTDNLAASPWIDVKASGLMGAPGKILRANIYADLPLLNYIYTQFNVQWYPDICFTTGKLITSAWQSQAIYFYGTYSQCTSPSNPLGTQIEYSGIIPPAAEQVRIALGVLSFCRFFANCSQSTNTTPWYDEIGFGIYGTPGAPFISADEVDLPQDNFPENGTLNPNAPGRVDSNNIQGDYKPEIGTTLGDTLIVSGGRGSAEVYVHFRVTPGPGTNATAFNTWYNSHANSAVEAGFRTARCDTTERGPYGPINGSWMTAYHESDPNFSGTDRDIDGADVAPNGGTWRLANDIFPDDLFTMGTRIDIFYTVNNVGSPGSFYKTPVGPGVYHEMEILPSSADAGLPTDWNCVLYVDHFGRGAQGYIEAALIDILGSGSENFEGTNWDRFDVNSASSQQMSFGRPLGTEYGASVIHALAYKAILWNTGNFSSFNLTKEDADVLTPWLTLLDFDFNNLYLSGDGLVHGVLTEGDAEPSARYLIEELAGVGLRTACANGRFRDADCPYPGAPVDLTPCVDLLPVVGAVVAGGGGGRSVVHQGQGNGCPELRSFDVLAVHPPQYGAAFGDEEYSTPVKSARCASTATDAASSGVLNYKIVVDGLSVHYRRDGGGPCDYELGTHAAVTERLDEVLDYFGYVTATLCAADVGGGTGVAPGEPVPTVHRTALTGAHPNPLIAGAAGRIRFSLAQEGPATVCVYDLQGRRVRTVFEGMALQGDQEATWNGTDESGVEVASGVYYLRLQAGSETRSIPLVLLKGGGR